LDKLWGIPLLNCCACFDKHIRCYALELNSFANPVSLFAI
jgi:hypothetical protein